VPVPPEGCPGESASCSKYVASAGSNLPRLVLVAVVTPHRQGRTPSLRHGPTCGHSGSLRPARKARPSTRALRERIHCDWTAQSHLVTRPDHPCNDSCRPATSAAPHYLSGRVNMCPRSAGGCCPDWREASAWSTRQPTQPAPGLLHRRPDLRRAAAGHAVRDAARRLPHNPALRHVPSRPRPPRRAPSRGDGLGGVAEHHQLDGDAVIDRGDPDRRQPVGQLGHRGADGGGVDL
jgi:hypothetical protein